MLELNTEAPQRMATCSHYVHSKALLQAFYHQMYSHFAAAVPHITAPGICLEIGSGGDHLKQYIPEVITSDIIEFAGIDQIIDARQLPFADASLKAILLFNSFHHIPDIKSFLHEASRCLAVGGKILLADQHVGILSYWILKYFHDEHFDHQALDWDFACPEQRATANGALAWIVFQRDLDLFTKNFPQLKFISYKTHSPLLYWASGGLSRPWSLPNSLLPAINFIDRSLLKLAKNFGSFNFIELEKRKPATAIGQKNLRQVSPQTSKNLP